MTPKLSPEERERRRSLRMVGQADRLAREGEERKKPQAAARVFRQRNGTVWFGRCPTFRPRTDDDANRATRL